MEKVKVKDNGFGYIRFESLSDAKEFALKNNGRVVNLSKKDGQMVWTNNGEVSEGFKFNKHSFGDNYIVISSIDELNEEISLWEKSASTSLEEAKEHSIDIEGTKETINYLKLIGDIVHFEKGESALISDDGFFCELLTPTNYDYDNTSHRIGVVLN